MCGRLHLTFLPDAEELFEHLFNSPFPQFEYPPILSDDILPFNDITTIYSNVDKPLARPMFWNLIPKTAPKFEPSRTWFNSRKEKLQEPYQNNLLKWQRCIVPANGFFENKKINGKPVFQSRKIGGKSVRKKESYEFNIEGQSLMMLAGIYDIWGKDQYSCSIITLEPNSMIGNIHDRMPFILPNDMVKVWLDKSVDDSDFLIDMIQPFPSEKLSMRGKWPPDKTDPREPTQMNLF